MPGFIYGQVEYLIEKHPNVEKKGTKGGHQEQKTDKLEEGRLKQGDGNGTESGNHNSGSF